MHRLLKAAQARKLDRIAAAYAVGGWILVQAASITFPTFGAPGWMLKVFIVAVLLGFPLTLGIAWVMAPHRQVAKGHSRLAPTTRTDIVLLSLLGLVIAVSFGQFVFKFTSEPEATPAREQPGTSTPAVAPEASIAVLPFVNLSGDPKKEYFSDGISEDLLNNLSNQPELRVAARTSSFAFKGKNEDIKEIARKLNVRHILEGSIREEGNRIRITAQLINAADGYHVWSQSYDRELTSVLVVQDEIARAISAALTHKLLPAKSAAASKSVDPEAYRKYLQGQAYLGPRRPEGIAKAVELFKEATSLQPDFADAYAALGRALINHAENRREQRSLISDAEAALARALELDPNNLGALATHLDLALHKLDWQTAAADARRMQAINPHSSTVLHEMFRYYQFLGFPQEALAAAQAAAILDPLAFVDRLNVTAGLIHIARNAEAVLAAQRALELEPDQPYMLALLCTAYARNGQIKEARAVAETLPKEGGYKDGCHFDIAVSASRLDEARKLVDKLAAQFPDVELSVTDFGDLYAVANDFDKAMKWFERAYAQREAALFTIPYDKTIAAAFFQDPRWQELSRRPLFKEWQAAHDKLAAELAQGG